ncbi:MAG: hypothetical protein AB8C84_05065 [Oligoflexales bacterium]
MKIFILLFINFSMFFCLQAVEATPSIKRELSGIKKKPHDIKLLKDKTSNILLYEERLLSPYLNSEDLYAFQTLSLQIKNMVVPSLHRLQLNQGFREDVFFKMLRSATRVVQKEMSVSSSDLFLATYLFLSRLSIHSVKGKVDQMKFPMHLRNPVDRMRIPPPQAGGGIQSIDACLLFLQQKIPMVAKTYLFRIAKNYQLTSKSMAELRCSSVNEMFSPLHLKYVFSLWRDALLSVKQHSWESFEIFENTLILNENDLSNFPFCKIFYNLQSRL